MNKQQKPAIDTTIRTTVDVSIKIPENSSADWIKNVEKWLRLNVSEVIEVVLDNHFEDELIEQYNDDFEGPDMEELSDLGEIKVSVIAHLSPQNQEQKKG